MHIRGEAPTTTATDCNRQQEAQHIKIQPAATTLKKDTIWYILFYFMRVEARSVPYAWQIKTGQ